MASPHAESSVADSPAPTEIDILREDIALNEALLASLKSEDSDDEVEDSRSTIKKTLKGLHAQLRRLESLTTMDPNSSDLHEGQSTGVSVSERSDASQPVKNEHLMPPPTMTLASRKRQRDETDNEDGDREVKSLRPSPSPYASATASPTTRSVDSFDFDDDPLLSGLLGSDWKDDARASSSYLRDLEARRKQEEEDEQFAKALAAEWEQQDVARQPPVSSRQQPTSSYSQAFLRPDGTTFQKHVPPNSNPTVPAMIFPAIERPIYSIPSANNSDSSLEEVSSSVVNRAGRPHGSSIVFDPASRPPLGHSMPGAFPGAPPYMSTSGSSVYGQYQHDDLMATLFPDLQRDRALHVPGSHNNPLDLDALGLPDRLRNYDSFYTDPAETLEELKNLLKNVRPDEEISEEERNATPPGLKVRLMPHQRAGLAWMKKMEEGTNKGGILADDMGLGKTLQAIALILSRPPPPEAHRPTLVVAPVALLEQWKREIEKMVTSQHRLQVISVHGSSGRTSWNAIRRHDIVLTTYGTLASELKRHMAWEDKLKLVPDAIPSKKDECPILSNRSKFWRVILDEAQWIKNRNTKSALAACRVHADYRWALSGTPMQNNIDEMYTMIKFCRIRPYNDYDKFARDIGRPLKGRRARDNTDRAMEKLQAVLKAILLRRNKTSMIDGRPILQLPEKNTVEERANFDDDEKDFYQSLETKARIQFNRYMNNGSIGGNYSNALVLLLRLRQACCHPFLVTNSKDFLQVAALKELDRIDNARGLPHNVVARLKETDAYECPICMDATDNPTIFQCGHFVCTDCLSKLVDDAMNTEDGQAKCPNCRGRIDSNRVTDLESFLRVHCPEREGVLPLDDGEASVTETESEDEVEDDSDSGTDLKDFIVEDAEYDSEADGKLDRKSSKKMSKMADIDYDSGEDNKIDGRTSKKSSGKSKKKKSKKRKSAKGKEKAVDREKTLAELRVDSLKNKAAKKKYLRRLEEDFQPSAKIKKTIQLLEDIKAAGKNEKTIIFSSFTSFLDLLEVPLSRHPDFEVYARYDGSMKPADRNDAVLKFTDSPHCKVILVSLKAGNAGLNLTAANHVIILDPFWNPFVEYQAADRCHRIGQMREVTVHRVLIGKEDGNHWKPGKEGDEDRADMDVTVEDRILRLQEKKKILVETALSETAAQGIARLGVRELGYLFGVNSLD